MYCLRRANIRYREQTANRFVNWKFPRVKSNSRLIHHGGPQLSSPTPKSFSCSNFLVYHNSGRSHSWPRDVESPGMEDSMAIFTTFCYCFQNLQWIRRSDFSGSLCRKLTWSVSSFPWPRGETVQVRVASTQATKLRAKERAQRDKSELRIFSRASSPSGQASSYWFQTL